MLICSKHVSITIAQTRFQAFLGRAWEGQIFYQLIFLSQLSNLKHFFPSPCTRHPISVPITSMPRSQSEFSQPNSNHYLIESCQGDESHTSQEENLLPTPRILWNLNLCILSLCRQKLPHCACLLWNFFSSNIYLCFIVTTLIFFNISVKNELQLIHLMCTNLQINSINWIRLNWSALSNYSSDLPIHIQEVGIYQWVIIPFLLNHKTAASFPQLWGWDQTLGLLKMLCFKWGY